MRRSAPSSLTAVAVALSVLIPALGEASPWVVGPGEWVVQGRYDYQLADSEFLDDGPAEPFSLRGEYSSSTYAFGARVGITGGFEVEIEIPIRQVSYTADPVIILPTEADPGPAFDYYQENVINLSRAQSGLGDVRLTGRYQFTGGRFASAVEVGFKTPTGYDPPSGTFGDRPKSEEQFLSEVTRFVRPDNVEDDVTLGDGQVDVSTRLLLGWGFSTRTFVRVDGGFVLRLGGAGDLYEGALRAGQLIGRSLLVYAGAELAYAANRGRVIGISVAAIDPRLPASEYGGTNNLLLRSVQLDYDRLVVPAGVIVRLGAGVEVNLSYSPTVWGRNTAAIHAFSVGVAVRGAFADSARRGP